MNVACRSYLQRDVLDHEPERAHVVGRRQHIVVAEVDLVLARRHLVMRGFDVEPHLLEREDDLAAHVFAEIDGREIEVAGGIVGFGGWLAVAALKQEELGLGPGLHREAALGRDRDDALQRRPRAAGERRAVRIGDVADDPPDASGASALELAAGSVHGKTWKVARSGLRYMSDSSIRTNPSIDDPSNMMWPSSASSNCPSGTSTFLMTPRMSVNCKRMNLTRSRSARCRISLRRSATPRF